MAENGKLDLSQIQQVPVVELHIRYSPATGEFQVIGSQIDQVIKLGMLEFAKLAVSQPQSERSSIVIPNVRMVT